MELLMSVAESVGAGFTGVLPNPAREASVTILATRVSAWSKMPTKSSPVRDGTTRELVLCRPYRTGPAILDRFHGLTPVAKIVQPLRGCVGQHALYARVQGRKTKQCVFFLKRGRKARAYDQRER